MDSRGSAGMSPLLERSETKLNSLIDSYDRYKQLIRQTLRLLLAGLIVHLSLVFLTFPSDVLLWWLLLELCWTLLLVFRPQKLYDLHSCKLKATTSYCLAIHLLLLFLMARSYHWSHILPFILDALLAALLVRAARQLTLLQESMREGLDQMRLQQSYCVQNYNRVSAKEPFQLLENNRESLSLSLSAMRAPDSLDSFPIHRLKKHSLHPPRDPARQTKQIYSH